MRTMNKSELPYFKQRSALDQAECQIFCSVYKHTALRAYGCVVHDRCFCDRLGEDRYIFDTILRPALMPYRKQVEQ